MKNITTEFLQSFVGGQMSLFANDNQTYYRGEIESISLDAEGRHIVVDLMWLAQKKQDQWFATVLYTPHKIPLRYAELEGVGEKHLKFFLQYILNKYEFFPPGDPKIIPASVVQGLITEGVVSEEEIQSRILKIAGSGGKSGVHPGTIVALGDLVAKFGIADLEIVERNRLSVVEIWDLYEDQSGRDVRKMHELLNSQNFRAKGGNDGK